MNNRVSLVDASKCLGMSQAQVRIMMQRNLLDIGIAFPPDEHHRNWSYVVFKDKLDKVMGLE